MNSPIKMLVMSVGLAKDNHTYNYLVKSGAPRDAICVCLPKQFEANASTYDTSKCDVFIYDEKNYINDDFEFFGFKPRNCGGVGRQGIAEAVDKFGDDYLCWQLDDDVRCYAVRVWDGTKVKATKIRKWKNIEAMIRSFWNFYLNTGVMVGGAIQMMMTGGGGFKRGRHFVQRRLYNNFPMVKGNPLNYRAFKYYIADDSAYNLYNTIINLTPMLSTGAYNPLPYYNQGDREDGNAVIYNGDCSWKKSYALRMICPWACHQFVKREANRSLFREGYYVEKLYPPILLNDNGRYSRLMTGN